MKQTKPTQKVLIKIEQYSDDTTRETIESLEFTGVNLEILKTIHPDPKEALKIALKVAYQLKVFDPLAKGQYNVLSRRMKGTIEVDQWKI
jgi:hypothetical protein